MYNVVFMATFQLKLNLYHLCNVTVCETTGVIKDMNSYITGI